MGLSIVTPPTAEPVTLAEAKAQCRVKHSDEDALIQQLTVAATRHIERTLSLALMARTYRLTLDQFADSIELPRGPVQSVTSVEYLDADGVSQALPSNYYSTDLVSPSAWLVRNRDSSWPTVLDGVNAVSVTYIAGFDELPAEYADLKHAILLLIGHWYANREAVNVGTSVTELPMAVDALIQPYRKVLV